jgi:Flp pilus assembly protein TadG
MRKSDRRGAAALEFALVAIPFLLLVLGLIEFGCLILTQHLITNAARAGARTACVNTDVQENGNHKPPEEIESEVRASLAGLLQDAEVEILFFDDVTGDWVEEPAATFQQRIAVEIEGHYAPLTPLFSLISFARDITLSTRSVVRSEGH